jgi:ABC-type nitrate/sulfonate/bicarbonate transport system substrate-binding protein
MMMETIMDMTIDRLWFTRCPVPSAATVAIYQGWLAEEFAPDGITVSSLAESRDKSVHLSHYSHSQPNLFRFGGYVPPLISRSRGTDVRVIGLSWSDRMAGLWALPGTPVRSPSDLKGLRLGVPRRLNDSIDWWRATVLAGYETALVVSGLAPGDLKLVDIDIAREFVADVTLGVDNTQSLWGARSQFAVQREEVAALIRGEVDLLYTDAAMGALLEAATGVRKVLDLACPEDAPGAALGFPTVLTVSGGLLDARPDLVTRWVGRLLDADAWARANEAETKRVAARDSGLPEDFVGLAYSPRVHCQLDVSLSANRIALLKKRHDLLLAHGFLAGPVDFDSFIDHGPLNAALSARQRDAA